MTNAKINISKYLSNIDAANVGVEDGGDVDAVDAVLAL
jgi:hypothetical protein